MSEPAGAAPRGGAEEKDRVVRLLGDEWTVLADLLGGISEQDWSRRALPGWDVHDVLAHIIGTERLLAGDQLPVAPDQPGPHVRNDIGRANEGWVLALREVPHADLLAAFRAVAADRLATLRAMTTQDYHAPSWTPAGQATFGRFMQIRVFDCWMHEQDIRAAVGEPGNERGPAAAQALDEVVLALGYIIGKRGRAPDGSSVLIRLTGPVERDLLVVVDGRARVVSAINGEPTASLSLSSSEFLRLAGGRDDPDEALGRVRLGGDQALARQLAMNLAYTI
jgi:uncharacterized protein (TIGR03083 family)